MLQPAGADCQFDGANLSQFKPGQFRGGALPGEVTISSRGKSPDGQDRLLVTTRNVRMSELDVSTSEVVNFRFGPHFGRGRAMHMRLMPRQGGRKNQAGTNIGGLEYFKVRSVEHLHLDMSKAKGATPQQPATAAARGPAGLDAAGMAGLPLEITCRGPFRFNVVQQRATFEDHVEVLQIHPSGPNDRLTCNLLTVSFTKKAGRSGAFDLDPQRIEANGTPAVLVAPAEKVYAAGQLLQYNLQTRSIALSDAREVVLRRDGDELHARGVRYDSAEPGRLGAGLRPRDPAGCGGRWPIAPISRLRPAGRPTAGPATAPGAGHLAHRRCRVAVSSDQSTSRRRDPLLAVGIAATVGASEAPARSDAGPRPGEARLAAVLRRRGPTGNVVQAESGGGWPGAGGRFAGALRPRPAPAARPGENAAAAHRLRGSSTWKSPAASCARGVALRGREEGRPRN